jgi:alpha-tubulin suppressor-like RCC1 family protein
LHTDGQVTAWGRNNAGQTEVPSTMHDIVAIAAGGDQSMALGRNGAVVSWGRHSGPTLRMSGIVAISAGEGHKIALDRDGLIHAWGANDYEQCDVPQLPRAHAISAGGLFSIAIVNDL